MSEIGINYFSRWRSSSYWPARFKSDVVCTLQSQSHPRPGRPPTNHATAEGPVWPCGPYFIPLPLVTQRINNYHCQTYPSDVFKAELNQILFQRYVAVSCYL